MVFVVNDGPPAILIRDVIADKEVRRITLPDGAPPSRDHASGWFQSDRWLAFSPDGKYLAAAALDHSIRVYETCTGEQLLTFAGHAGGPSICLAFSPDGKTLVSGSTDTSLMLWDLRPHGLEKSRKLDAQDLDRLYDALLGKDTSRAYQAIWMLAEAGEAAVRLCKRRLSQDTGKERWQQWLSQLDHDHFEVREQATLALETAEENVVPLLLAALTDSPSLEKRVRLEKILAKGPMIWNVHARRIVAVLERIGTPEACTALESLVKSRPESCLAMEAESALLRLAGRPPLSPFVQALRHPDRSIRGKAIETLAISDPKVEGSIPALKTALQDPVPEVRRQALRAFSQCARRSKEFVPTVAGMLTDPDPEVQIKALETLASLGALAVPHLQAALKHKNATVRRQAADALDAIAALGKADLQTLIDALQSEDQDMSFQAAQSFSRLGKEAVPELVKLLQNSEPPRRALAAFALGHVGPEARQAAPALVQALIDPRDRNVRYRAAEALARIDPREGLLWSLCWALSDDDVDVRGRAAETLVQLGSKSVPTLIEALSDVDCRSRTGAAKALGDIRPRAKDAVPALRELLKDSDDDVREAAKQALRQIEEK